MISITGYYSKCWTISVLPHADTWLKGVKLNIGIQFHEWYRIEISWKNSIEILWMLYASKCLWSWFQYLVVIIEVEYSWYGLLLKPKLNEYNKILEFNSMNDWIQKLPLQLILTLTVSRISLAVFTFPSCETWRIPLKNEIKRKKLKYAKMNMFYSTFVRLNNSVINSFNNFCQSCLNS